MVTLAVLLFISAMAVVCMLHFLIATSAELRVSRKRRAELPAGAMRRPRNASERKVSGGIVLVHSRSMLAVRPQVTPALFHVRCVKGSQGKGA